MMQYVNDYYYYVFYRSFEINISNPRWGFTKTFSVRAWQEFKRTSVSTSRLCPWNTNTKVSDSIPHQHVCIIRVKQMILFPIILSGMTWSCSLSVIIMTTSSSCVIGRPAYQLLLIIFHYPSIDPVTREIARLYINHCILNKSVSLDRTPYR